MGEVGFILLCLSSFINKRPWLLAIPMAVFALSYGVSVGALIELVLAALFGATAAGIIRNKLPAAVVTGVYAAGYIVTAIAAGTGYGDELIAPLMWTAVLLAVLSLKKNAEA